MTGGIDIAELLEEHNACGEGITDAIAVFGPTLPPGVSVAWAVAVACAYEAFRLRRWTGWAVGRLVLPEEVGVVAGSQLAGAYLCRANLSGDDLSGANLRGAVLAYVNLTGANLAGASLADADLTGAWLDDADLTGADLTNTDLTNANLTCAFRGPDDPPVPGWVVARGRLRKTS